MDIGLIIWFYFPIVIGLLIIGGSFFFTAKKIGIFGFSASLLILVLNGFSIYILIRILIGGYATFIPHILISISGIILLFQRYWIKKRKTFANNE